MLAAKGNVLVEADSQLQTYLGMLGLKPFPPRPPLPAPPPVQTAAFREQFREGLWSTCPRWTGLLAARQATARSHTGSLLALTGLNALRPRGSPCGPGPVNYPQGGQPGALSVA